MPAGYPGAAATSAPLGSDMEIMEHRLGRDSTIRELTTVTVGVPTILVPRAGRLKEY